MKLWAGAAVCSNSFWMRNVLPDRSYIPVLPFQLPRIGLSTHPFALIEILVNPNHFRRPCDEWWLFFPGTEIDVADVKARQLQQNWTETWNNHVKSYSNHFFWILLASGYHNQHIIIIFIFATLLIFIIFIILIIIVMVFLLLIVVIILIIITTVLSIKYHPYLYLPREPWGGGLSSNLRGSATLSCKFPPAVLPS